MKILHTPLSRRFSALGLSPWMLAGAALILGLTLVGLSVRSNQRERAFMVHNLTDRAETLIWALEAGTRTGMDRLLKHSWPGNVRELENAVERAVVLLVGEYISERELPPTICGQEPETQAAPKLDFANMTLEEIERLAVMGALPAAACSDQKRCVLSIKALKWAGRK